MGSVTVSDLRRSHLLPMEIRRYEELSGALAHARIYAIPDEVRAEGDERGERVVRDAIDTIERQKAEVDRHLDALRMEADNRPVPTEETP